MSLFLMAFLPQSAEAKGLLESLFGFLGPKQSAAGAQNGREKSSEPRSSTGRALNPFHQNPGGSQPYTPRSYGGRYKTVCVRLCDGYFFPISNSSRRQQFYEDAQQCKSRCSSSETRLFFMSPRSPSIKTARDIRGFGYSKLKTAFSYRKALKPGCTCRAKPWSVSERLRHHRYELAELGKSNQYERAPVESDARIEPVVLNADTDSDPDIGEMQPVLASASRSLTGKFAGTQSGIGASRGNLIVANAAKSHGDKQPVQRQARRPTAPRSSWVPSAMGFSSGEGYLFPGDLQ